MTTITTAPPSRSRGFTLIELMITVAIVGILAAVAYPSYTEYVQRGRLAEATGEIGTMRVRLEQFYQDNRNYGSTGSACGVPTPAATPTFTFSCDNGGGSNQTFLITATGSASMSGFEFTVDHNNNQQTTAFPGASGLPAACWLTKRGGTC